MLKGLVTAFANLSEEKKGELMAELTKGIRTYWSSESAIVDGVPIGGVYIDPEFGLKIVEDPNANH